MTEIAAIKLAIGGVFLFSCFLFAYVMLRYLQLITKLSLVLIPMAEALDELNKQDQTKPIDR